MVILFPLVNQPELRNSRRCSGYLAPSARYLFSSHFRPDVNAGAAGSLLALAEQLERLGHRVDQIWQPEHAYRLPHARLQEAFELPEVIRRRMAQALDAAPYDYVIASQPYAYRAFEWLKPRYPSTVFLNRTHGWETRMIDQNRRLRWRRESPAREVLSRASQMATARACQRVAQASHGVIASCELCAAHIRQRYRVPDRQVAVIPHGADLGPIQKAKTNKALKLLFVGQYLPRKGSSILEQVLPGIMLRHPEAQLTFVVPPESIAFVEKQFRPAVQQRLTVHAWLPREKLAQIYGDHDILLYPSLFEGFGKVFLEGMAAELCVIGFAEGGLADLARHGYDALFTEAGDVAGLRRLLDWALLHREETKRMGRTAAATASQLTWERAARDTHRFCQLRQASLVTETVMAPVGQLSTASRIRLAASVFAKIGLATLVSATLSSSN